MLKKVRRVAHEKGTGGYSCPQEDALVNTDDIVAAHPCEERGSGPFVKLVLRGGHDMTVVGTVDSVLPNVATYTHDAAGKEELLARLRRCDGRSSDCAVITWENAQLLADLLGVPK